MNDEPRPDTDPIGEWLGRNLPEVREPEPARVARPMRPSARKFAALGLGIVLVLAGGVAGLRVLGPGRGPDAVHPGAPALLAGDDGDADSVGRVLLVDGAVTIETGGTDHAALEGDPVRPGDVIEARLSSAVGIEIASRTTLLILGDARARVVSRGAGSVTLMLERGFVAGYDRGRNSGVAVAIASPDTTVSPRAGSVFTVEAHGREISKVSVASGILVVTGRQPAREQEIVAGEAFDAISWERTGDAQASRALLRLSRLVDLPVGSSSDATQEEAGSVEAEGKRDGADPKREIEEALASGDVDGAVSIAGSVDEGCGDASLLMAAGDAYKHAGMWDEASGVYLAAADVADGKKAERALLRAAGLSTGKLKEHAEAAAIIESYLDRFPQGSYLDEGLYLGGVVYSKLGDHARAIELFEEYLEGYPDGSQAVRVHVALAGLLASTQDCTAALSHVRAVREMGAGGSVEKTLARIETTCGGGEKE